MNRRLISLPAFVALAFAHAAQAGNIVYDASLGTLPDQQGFTYNSSNVPTPTVSGGILYQDSTTPSTVQYYSSAALPLDFAAQFSMEVDLRVISSAYATNLDHTGNQRSGYYLQAADADNRALLLGISSGGVYVNNNDNDPDNGGTGFIPFDTTSGFHDYLVTDDAGAVNLFVDGQLLGTTTVQGPSFPSAASEFYFGDGTYYEGSQTQLKFAAYSDTLSPLPAIPTPEPSSILLCSIGGTMGLLTWWRRRRGGRQSTSSSGI